MLKLFNLYGISLDKMFYIEVYRQTSYARAGQANILDNIGFDGLFKHYIKFQLRIRI